MQIKIQIKNLPGLLDAFRAAPENTKRNMERTLWVSMREIQEQARAVHGFTSRSHNLERSVDTEMLSNVPLAGRIFLNENIAKYGPFQHAGTGIHGPNGHFIQIFPKTGTLLRWVDPKTGRFVYAKKVLYNPGVKPDPFLYEAAKVKASAVNAHFNEAVKQSIKEAGL